MRLDDERLDLPDEVSQVTLSSYRWVALHVQSPFWVHARSDGLRVTCAKRSRPAPPAPSGAHLAHPRPEHELRRRARASLRGAPARHAPHHDRHRTRSTTTLATRSGALSRFELHQVSMKAEIAEPDLTALHLVLVVQLPDREAMTTLRTFECKLLQRSSERVKTC
jgi:hypothetical protein